MFGKDRDTNKWILLIFSTNDEDLTPQSLLKLCVRHERKQMIQHIRRLMSRTYTDELYKFLKDCLKRMGVDE